MLKRFPINVAVGNTKDRDGNKIPLLYAICNDGTIWLSNDNGPWEKFPDIPQPEVKG